MERDVCVCVCVCVGFGGREGGEGARSALVIASSREILAKHGSYEHEHDWHTQGVGLSSRHPHHRHTCSEAADSHAWLLLYDTPRAKDKLHVHAGKEGAQCR